MSPQHPSFAPCRGNCSSLALLPSFSDKIGFLACFRLNVLTKIQTHVSTIGSRSIFRQSKRRNLRRELVRTCQRLSQVRNLVYFSRTQSHASVHTAICAMETSAVALYQVCTSRPLSRRLAAYRLSTCSI